MQHLEEGTIHAWLDGALPAKEAESVEAHVAQCAECAALVAEARGLIAGTSRIVSSLDHVPAGVVPKQHTATPSSLWSTLRLTPARASIAALVLVGVASMFTARRGELRAPDSESIVRLDTVAAGAPAVSAPSLPPNIVAGRETASVTGPVPRSPVAAKRDMAELAKPAAPASAPASAPAPPPSEMRAVAPAPEPSAVAGVAASKLAEAVGRADSARARRDSAMAQRNFAGASAATAQRMMRQAFDLSASTPQGCYRLLTDSARIAIPEQFALQRDSIGRNVVLRVSAEDRPAGALDGFAWSQTSPTTARLTTPSTQLLLTTTESGRARLETPNGTIEVPLQRKTCRP